MSHTDTAHSSATYLTQEAHDRLQHELDELSGPGRTDIAKRIEAARDEGDLKENGGYHAAKDEQGQIEGRIRQLTELLRHAEVGQAAADGTAGPGMVVEVVFDGEQAVETFLIGSREGIASTELEIYSAQSPLGRALTGAKIGETVTYALPNGGEMSATLRSATPYSG